MIPSVKKILYATDLSPNSAYVFRYVLNTAVKHDAKIVILHVLEELSPASLAAMDIYLSDKQRKKIYADHMTEAVDRAQTRIKKFCKKQLKTDPNCAKKIAAIEVCEGFPAEEILRKTNELKCDTIVLGAHGKGFIENTFLGSTAKRVLRRTRCPVYIVPILAEHNDSKAEEM